MGFQNEIINAGLTSVMAKAVQGSIGRSVVATGSSQANAKRLINAINVVTTTPVNSGVLLPVMREGDSCVVYNLGAFNLNVYPMPLGVINEQAADVPVVVVPGGVAYFYGIDFLVCLADLGVGSGGSAGDATWIDAESPSGVIDGFNTSFHLASTPNPPASLRYFMNGALLTAGVDFTLSDTAILTGFVPQIGDVFKAFYRTSNGSGSIHFADAQVPIGAINGSNAAYILNPAPSPALSLELYANGLLLTSGLDYTLTGTSLTYNIPLQTGDNHVAWYRY